MSDFAAELMDTLDTLTIATDDYESIVYMLDDEHTPAKADERREYLLLWAARDLDEVLDPCKLGAEQRIAYGSYDEDLDGLRLCADGEAAESYWFAWTGFDEARIPADSCMALDATITA